MNVVGLRDGCNGNAFCCAVTIYTREGQLSQLTRAVKEIFNLSI